MTVLYKHPPPEHLHRGVTSCPSAELFVPSKHSMIDAAANQDSDHTVMLLQPTDTTSQIQTGGLLLHTTLSDDSVLAGAFSILRTSSFLTTAVCKRYFYLKEAPLNTKRWEVRLVFDLIFSSYFWKPKLHFVRNSLWVAR